MVTTPNTEQPSWDGSYSPGKVNPLREIFDEQVRLYGKEQVVGTALELMGVESRAQFLAEHFPETVKVAAFTPRDEEPGSTTVKVEQPTAQTAVAEAVAHFGLGDVLHALLDLDEKSSTPGALDLQGLVAGLGRKRGYKQVADATMNLLSVETLAELLTKYVRSVKSAALRLPEKDRAELTWDVLESNGVHLDEWVRSLEEDDRKTALDQLQQLYIERRLLSEHDDVELGSWLRELGRRFGQAAVARDALHAASISEQLEALGTMSATVLGEALKKLSGPNQARLLTLLQHEVKKSGPEGAVAAVRRVAEVHGRLKVAKAACGELSTAEGRELLESWDPRDPIFGGDITDSVKKALDVHGVKLADVVLNQIEDGAVVPIILRRLAVVPNEPEGTEKRLARQEVEEALLAAMFRPKPGQIMTLEAARPQQWVHTPMATYKVVLRLNRTTVLHEGLQLPVQEMGQITRVTVPVVQEDGDQYELVRCYIHHVEYVPAMGELPERRVLVVDREDGI